jgi:transcriptional regulator with XRE-family HTH domain
MPRPKRPAPREGAEDWPIAPMSDPVNEAQRRFAVNLREAIGEMSIRKAAEFTNVDRTTLRNLLEGETWVDAVALAKLERAFERTLWPGYFKQD